MSLELVPISQKVARDAVLRWHRHNAPPAGDVIRVGVAEYGELVAVGIAGRPVARHYDDGQTLEILRVSSSGAKNATSMIYGALRRAGFALGYTRIITYTQAGESGSSLKADRWTVVGQRPRRNGWNSIARPRDDARYISTERTLWEATL